LPFQFFSPIQLFILPNPRLRCHSPFQMLSPIQFFILPNPHGHFHFAKFLPIRQSKRYPIRSKMYTKLVPLEKYMHRKCLIKCLTESQNQKSNQCFEFAMYGSYWMQTIITLTPWFTCTF